MASHSPNFTANGTVHVCRVVTTSAISGSTTSPVDVAGVVECGTTQMPVGVSQEGCYDTPGLSGSDVTIAARSGKGVHVYGLGERCWVLVSSAGLAVSGGARVKVVTSDGQVGPLVGAGQGGQWIVGFALKSALPGELLEILIDPQQVAIPQS